MTYKQIARHYGVVRTKLGIYGFFNYQYSSLLKTDPFFKINLSHCLEKKTRHASILSDININVGGHHNRESMVVDNYCQICLKGHLYITNQCL